ncbi:hypothetical protein OSTOST_05446 [Ostertagia ostertagi]
MWNISDPNVDSPASDDNDSSLDTMDIIETLSRQVIRPLALLASLAGIDIDEEEMSSRSDEEIVEEEPDDTVIRQLNII